MPPLPQATASPAVNAYIDRAQPFAQPILRHLCETMHRVVPGVEEAIKWSMPFFLYKGIILANMAGHRTHASFGLWGPEMAKKRASAQTSGAEGMGSFGRLKALDDLPAAAELEARIRDAAELVSGGTRTRSFERPKHSSPLPDVSLPEALARALAGHAGAAERFAAMPPGCRREYATWIAEAKRAETRERRAASAIERIADGLYPNDRYKPGAARQPEGAGSIAGAETPLR